VAADIAGAQSQVLSAAQMSIWARVKGVGIQELGSAIWKERSLVRAWAMRRTMFLLPSNELAIFVRGTTRRAEYHLRWAIRHVGSEQGLEKLLDAVLEILKKPSTRGDLAETLRKSFGYKLKSKAGGGWGNRTKIPWVEVGSKSLPVGYLLHVISARDVICSGPSKGNEATYVRADKWIHNWKDLPPEKAERLLLVKYLKAFEPSMLQDFALWAGMYVRDAKKIWEKEVENMAQVDVEGWKANILQSDIPELEKAEVEGPVVRLLPFFDSFLLGHKSHRNIVDEKDYKKVYRNQGWVSPVLLVDGRAQGVWSHVQKKDNLELRVTPFSHLSNNVSLQLQEEASDLGRFLECPNVNTVVAKDR
jgi:winged helix DNA-binding protein